MFNFIQKFATKKDLSSLDVKLGKSFKGVKTDTKTLYEWIKYMNQKIESQQIILESLNQKISNLPSSDYGKEIKDTMENIHVLNSKLNETIHFCHHLDQKTDHINHNLVKDKTPIKSFKEKLIKKITKNSKNYVKTIILNLISKYEGLSSTKLREIVVEEQGLCSKSSFYRTLTELEKSGELEVHYEGPERIYLPKLLKSVRQKTI